MAHGTWRPLLVDSLAERARESVEDLAEALRQPPTELAASPSVAGGLAGAALFYAYLDRAWPHRGHDELAERYLDRAAQEVARARSPGLFAGFAGVAWAVEHLASEEEEEDDDDPNEEVDAAVLEELAAALPCAGEYDLIGGLVGLGVYLLERLPRPSARRGLERIVDRLSDCAEHGDAGAAWLTRPENIYFERDRRECPEGRYDLGLAHGVAGVIAFLGRVVAESIATPRAEALLRGAVRWLLANRLPAGSEATFSSFTRPGAPGAYVPRAAWCYGDPGAAVALLIASRSAGDTRWEAEALRVARHVAIARDPSRVGATDAGLCHGSVGLAHIYNRMAQATGDLALGRAATFWYERTLDFRSPGSGLAGYRSWLPDLGRGQEVSPAVLRADPSFLTGAAGIGLALLAGISDVAPDWDRMMLTCVAPMAAQVAA